ncbi:MAG: carboxypeptidase regulatory-like domain-containing protein [Acidobacteria bacterium]|nr:MAG: carboxypeptidase regulatory-like domain-containing protein [Acidobacteriota bacterium]
MKRLLVFAVTLALCSSVLFAQGGAVLTTGTISGVIKDPTGAVIPGAEVVVHNVDTDAKRTVVSDDSGFYTVPNVPTGMYTVSVTMPGFKTSTSQPFKVDIRSNRIQDLTMEVGSVDQQITVEGASAAQVELRSGEVANLISGEQVTELPLNGRSFVQLSLLVPGASAAQDANVRFTGLLAGVDISFSGSPSNANMWLVDGTNNVDIGSGRTILTYPSVDSIAEFKIQRNSYAADMAASSGAQINVVTKSGTNEFHGSLYEFHRNSALNATNFFLNRAGQDKQALIYNNFGYTVGGPIVKDKAFFFWSQEWRREGRGVPRQNLVPTDLERQGDFSGPNTRDYPDPTDPLTGLPFPENKIPADRLSPAGLALLNLYPRANLSLDSPNFSGFNWVAAPKTPLNTRQEQIRADWNITENHSVMGRLTLDTWKNPAPSFVEGGLWGDDPFPIVDSNWDQPGRSLTTQWTSTFGTGTVNQVSFSWSGNEIIVDRGSGETENEAVNATIPEVFPGPEGHGHAVFWGDPLGHDLWNQPPWQNRQDLFVWKDDFSKVIGDHSFKIGGLFSHNRKDEDIDNNSAAYAPEFWSNGGEAIPGGTPGGEGSWGPPEALGRGDQVTGNGVADLLLKGTYWGGGVEDSTNPRSRVRWRDYELYFADTWRLTSRLTLNYGVRWSYLPNPWDDQNQIGNFVLALYDPAAGAVGTNGMLFPDAKFGTTPDAAGLEDVDDRALVKNYFSDFSPRIGFAWDPTGQGKWAIRAGAGMFYNREAISDVLTMTINPPFRTTITWDNGRPLDGIPASMDFTGGSGVAQTGKALEAKTPGSYQWNLTVERELWRDTKAEIGYVANRGHHIPGWFDMNQVPVALRTQYATLELDTETGTETDGGPLRPLFPLVGDVTNPRVASRSFDSWYHSFQAYLVKRFSQNFSYQLSYTFSKLLSTAYGLGHIGGNVVSDPFNIGYDKGLASFDRPHIFSANLIYRTPALAGSNALVQALLGGWESSIIVTANSGRPETITCCENFTGTESNRPDLVGDPEGPQTVDAWFDVNAFRPPPVVGLLGNSPRSQIRGPGINNWDLSFMKNFGGLPWWNNEGATLQFRAEFFNAFNHTQFQLVDTDFEIANESIDASGNLLGFEQNNSNFGQVTRVREPREIQFALKILW